MKTTILPVLLAVVLTVLAGCQEQVNQSSEKPAQEEAGEIKNNFISGKVTAIQQGKDGYTATLITAEKAEYRATISRANLTDPTTYRAVQTGETIRVKGDHWQMENQNHITVRELK